MENQPPQVEASPAAVSAAEPAKPTSLLTSLGINVEAAGKPYWKPDGRVRRIRVLAVRKPDTEEASKKLPDVLADDGRTIKKLGDTITVLAIADLEVDGAPHVWEISSRRALQALDAVLVSLPQDFTVVSRGSGTSTSYAIAVAKDEPKAVAARSATPTAGTCYAPHCALAPNHAGKHKTAEALKAELGSTTTTVLVPHDAPAA